MSIIIEKPLESRLKDVSELQKKPGRLKVKKVTILIETEETGPVKIEMEASKTHEVLIGNLTLARGIAALPLTEQPVQGFASTDEMDVETCFYVRRRT